jgi:hypothetical protein
MNCDGGACTGSARICLAGGRKGFPCLGNSHCPGASCGTTGKVCLDGASVESACVDNADCGGAQCGVRPVTPTPTRTTGPGDPTQTPTHTPGPGICAGDCDGSDNVSINELITLVNIALGARPISACLAGDLNNNQMIGINELIGAVNRALNGCGD